MAWSSDSSHTLPLSSSNSNRWILAFGTWSLSWNFSLILFEERASFVAVVSAVGVSLAVVPVASLIGMASIFPRCYLQNRRENIIRTSNHEMIVRCKGRIPKNFTFPNHWMTEEMSLYQWFWSTKEWLPNLTHSMSMKRPVNRVTMERCVINLPLIPSQVMRERLLVKTLFLKSWLMR